MSGPGQSPRRRSMDDRVDVGARIPVSPLCLGIVADPRMVEAAYEAGVNFFFLSADMHWVLYDALRRGLAALLKARPARRDDIVVAATAYVTQPEFSYVPFLEAIEAVDGLDHLDMTIIGGARASDFLTRLVIYQQHSRPGVLSVPGVSSLGATFHDRAAARIAIDHHLVDLGLLRYNPLHPGAESEVFPLLGREGRSRIFNFNSTRGCLTDAQWSAMKFSSTHWRPTHTDYYRFALARPEIDGLLVALKSDAELRGVLGALAADPLSTDDLDYMRALGDLAAGRAALDEEPAER